MQQLNIQPFLKIGGLIVFFIITIFLYHFLFPYVYPFIIAFIISVMLHPIVSYIENKYRLTRSIASYLTILSIISLIGLFTYLFSHQIIIELSQITAHLPENFQKINELFLGFGQSTLIPIYDQVQTKLFFLPDTKHVEIEKTIPYITDKLYESSNDIITNILLSTSTLITSISQASLVIIFISLSILIMTKDFTNMQQIWQQFIPLKTRKKASEIFFHLKKSTFGLIKAQFFLACLTSCIVLIAFLIIGIDHLFVITLLIFLVDFIPYIGIGIIFVPWLLFSFLNGDYPFAIQLISLYMLIIIVRQFIEPKMIATHLHIHPLIALIILFASIQYFGLSGIIFTPILLIILSAMYHANIFTLMWEFISDKK